ncbi:helix-turn-helix transcriptional regulator [Actinokineospora auranticolor]|uniref:Helix-turn-helix protein n=1 Tax=Actinokineospora auranticolor TaxID=155976 RepID=A0A2S6GZJ5_9PSEU|nr:helix-turn-helix transcriptional regulator [Actinokineospora auranticolor]PPK70581.1 helix-turn-helix protein [Actinokineospora auranticolor]
MRREPQDASRERRLAPISEVLPRLRREQGLTQDDLATRLLEVSGNEAITREAVSRWERGKRIPGPYWRDWLGQVLEVPRPDLDLAAASARRDRHADHRGLVGLSGR